jgi:hypothetical protein
MLDDVVACLGHRSSDVVKIVLVELHGLREAYEHLSYQQRVLRPAEEP